MLLYLSLFEGHCRYIQVVFTLVFLNNDSVSVTHSCVSACFRQTNAYFTAKTTRITTPTHASCLLNVFAWQNGSPGSLARVNGY